MPPLLLKNPLASGFGILLLLALIACGIQSRRLSSAQSELVGDKLAFSDFKKDLAEKSLKVVQDAMAKSADQINALMTEVHSIGAIGAQTKTEIHNVQSSSGPCTADPAWRATVGGVQRILDGSASDKPRSNQTRACSSCAKSRRVWIQISR